MKAANQAMYLGFAFGSVAVSHQTGVALHWALFAAGAALSLTVWLFLQFGSKFYLSELLIIVMSFGVEVTTITNAARNPQLGFLVCAIVVTMLLPFVVFYFINARRKPEERLRAEAAGLGCVGK